MPPTNTYSKKRSPPSGPENENPNTSCKRSNNKNFFVNGKENDNDYSTHDRKRKHQKHSFVNNNSKTVEASSAKRHNNRKHGTKMRSMSCLEEALPDLSPTEKEITLSKITSEYDRNLQVVLFEVDCNYVLLEHQFTGVRALTYVRSLTVF